MALRDVTHVVFDRGDGPFNEQAALEAYHLVAKMDDSDAAEFVFHVVNEVVEDTIVSNREVVQKHLDRTIAKALVYADLDAIAEGLNAEERAEVKKELLTAVSKADFDPIEHPRGQSGRFTIDPHHRIEREEADRRRAAGEGDIPNHPDMAKDSETPMSRAQREMFRGQYAQIAAKIGALTGEKDVTLHYADGSSKQVSAASASKLAEQINPHQAKNVVAVEVSDYKPTIGGRVADLTSSLAAGPRFISSGTPDRPLEGNSSFAQQWYSASPTNSSQQTFNRIAAGSQLLDQVGGGSPKLKAAASFGSFVGQHGPAAEQVFGPPSRRMAYRYRGTERRPDRSLSSVYGAAVHSTKTQSGKYTPEQNITRAPSWGEREAGREQIVAWLQQEGRAPNRALSALQLAAGHTPPSEGVLLNADGQIVTTAVGAGDDWYLPFNLRHLASLKGGEYIRSRSTGGLTTEDIYTGLMAGARRVTVVSRSGVFSVEFDPELRGGRRNNDKALRMSRRYGELLDAVQSGKVERQNLSPEAMAEIRNEITSMYGSGLSGAERQTATRALIEERKANPEKITAKITELEEQRARIEEDRELIPEEKISFNEKMIGLQSQKEYFFRLNGLGYKAAQEALKEQFPYYIASATTVHHIGSSPVAARDRGYVEPGALRPTAARANLFGGAEGPNGAPINPQKTALSARRADRAIPFVDRYGGGDPSGAIEAAPERPEGPSGGGGMGMPKARESVEDVRVRLLRKEAQRNAAVSVHAGLKGWVDAVLLDGKPHPGAAEARRYAAMPTPEFAQKMHETGELEKFHKAITDAIAGDPDYTYPGKKEFEEAMGPKSGGKYDFGRAAASPLMVFEFDDLSAPVVNRAGQQRLALNVGTTVGEATEDQLNSEATLRAKVDSAVRDLGAVSDAEKLQVVNSLLESAGLLPPDEAGRAVVAGYVTKPELLHRSMENIQIQRAVNAKRAGVAQVPASPEVQAHAALMGGGASAPSGRKLPSAEQYQNHPGFDWNRPESEWPT